MLSEKLLPLLHAKRNFKETLKAFGAKMT